MPKTIRVNFVAGTPESETLKKTLDDLTKNRKKFQVKTTGKNSMEIVTDDLDHNAILTSLGSKGLQTAVESLEDVLVSKLLEGADPMEILDQLDNLTETPQTLQEGIGGALLTLAGSVIAAQKLQDLLRASGQMKDLQVKLKDIVDSLKDITRDLEDQLK